MHTLNNLSFPTLIAIMRAFISATESRKAALNSHPIDLAEQTATKTPICFELQTIQMVGNSSDPCHLQVNDCLHRIKFILGNFRIPVGIGKSVEYVGACCTR